MKYATIFSITYQINKNWSKLWTTYYHELGVKLVKSVHIPWVDFPICKESIYNWKKNDKEIQQILNFPDKIGVYLA